jgi:hypothetical protein
VPDAGPAEVVYGLTAAYCPVIAASGAPTYQKDAEMRGFATEVEVDVSAPAGAAPVTRMDVIWATPVGHTLVYREPAPFIGKLTCPADDGKLVPQDLVAKASAIVDKPALPVSGERASQFAVRLMDQNPKAAPADVANALITAYCGAVAANASADPSLKRAWLLDFGSQVIQTLQARTLASNKG